MKINMHYPTSEEGCAELSRRISEVHADITLQYIEKLSCSNEQKIALIDAVIAVKKQEDKSSE